MNLFRLHGEAYMQTDFCEIFSQIQPKLNGVVLGLWPTFQHTFMKCFEHF